MGKQAITDRRKRKLVQRKCTCKHCGCHRAEILQRSNRQIQASTEHSTVHIEENSLSQGRFLCCRLDLGTFPFLFLADSTTSSLSTWIFHTTQKRAIPALSLDQPSITAIRAYREFCPTSAIQFSWIGFVRCRQITVANIACSKRFSTKCPLLACKGRGSTVGR